MPYATYRSNKTIATATIRFIVTVAIVVYKGSKLVVYRMLTFCHIGDILRFVCDIDDFFSIQAETGLAPAGQQKTSKFSRTPRPP